MKIDDNTTREIIVDYVMGPRNSEQALADICLGYLIANQTFDEVHIRNVVGMFLELFDDINHQLDQYLIETIIADAVDVDALLEQDKENS